VPTMNRLRKNIGKYSIYNGLKKIKYLEINLTKLVKDLYSENYKLLKKENKNYRIWKDLLRPWIGRINIAKSNLHVH
jgi:hypothetical protein